LLYVPLVVAIDRALPPTVGVCLANCSVVLSLSASPLGPDVTQFLYICPLLAIARQRWVIASSLFFFLGLAQTCSTCNRIGLKG